MDSILFPLAMFFILTFCFTVLVLTTWLGSKNISADKARAWLLTPWGQTVKWIVLTMLCTFFLILLSMFLLGL